MPATTPIYAFPYPCPGDTVNASSFSALANAIDAKLLELAADADFALNRPNLDLSTAGTQVINAGVVTTLTTPDSGFTVPTAGVWVIWVEVFNTVSPPTITYQRVQVLQNAVVRYGFTQDSEGNNTATARPMGVIVAAAGDVVTTTYLYAGTGTTTVQTRLAARLLCRIP